MLSQLSPVEILAIAVSLYFIVFLGHTSSLYFFRWREQIFRRRMIVDEDTVIIPSGEVVETKDYDEPFWLNKELQQVMVIIIIIVLIFLSLPHLTIGSLKD